ncbi:MAG: MBL fold metallo-hydrolase, partial [Acidobacteriota bacterium]
MNMTVLEYGDDMVVIDAGLMFPEEDMLGIDYVIPDFTYILENREKVKGIVLSHGHEDHTGALPFLLKELNVPVYGTPLTLGLVREKLK